jgi:ubiquinol-cytochrome c reductase cytochrome b subunit
MFTLLGLYPWIESWVTGDKREHHILDRPRNAATRTSLGVMALTFYGILWISGGNDIIATQFNLAINTITWTFRAMIFIVPPLAFVITKRICLGLQRRDQDKLLHGYETGQILRLPHGEFIEVHAPISDEEKAVLLSKQDIAPLALAPATDDAGVRNPKSLTGKLRGRLSNWYFADNVALPSDEELRAAAEHAEHQLHAAAEQSAISGH